MSGRPGQVGVLDIGCFSANPVVVAGSPPHPVVSHKTRLRLDRALDPHNRLRPGGVEQVVTAVRTARLTAERAGGRHTGALLVLDVGGGTVEFAAGEDLEPSFTRSLPFDVRTSTRRLALDRTVARDHRGLAREQVRVHDRVVAALEGTRIAEHRAVGCSKVFRQSARPAGARPLHEGPFVPRALKPTDLRGRIPRPARIPVPSRARLPASPGTAPSSRSPGHWSRKR